MALGECFLFHCLSSIYFFVAAYVNREINLWTEIVKRKQIWQYLTGCKLQSDQYEHTISKVTDFFSAFSFMRYPTTNQSLKSCCAVQSNQTIIWFIWIYWSKNQKQAHTKRSSPTTCVLFFSLRAWMHVGGLWIWIRIQLFRFIARRVGSIVQKLFKLKLCASCLLEKKRTNSIQYIVG